MEHSEIRHAMAVGHPVVIDVRELQGAPGHLRTVTIYSEKSVEVEYQRCVDFMSGAAKGRV
jgi:hypothetical protein